MGEHLQQSINKPIREGLSLDDRWSGPDKGLIGCWERGREKREEEPELAGLAANGELVTLAWRGGIVEKRKSENLFGSLQYLATWQGLRGDNLDIDPDAETRIVCTRTGQAVVFRAKPPPTDNE